MNLDIFKIATLTFLYNKHLSSVKAEYITSETVHFVKINLLM